MRRRNLGWPLAIFVAIAVGALAACLALGDSPLLGLDLRGGVSVVLRPQGTVDNATLQQAVTIIDRRVNGLGVANSEIQRQGSDVVINLPGIKDSQAALRTLSTTAKLYFRPVACYAPPYTPAAASAPAATAPGATTPTTARAGASSASTPASPTTASPSTSAPKSAGVPVQASLTAFHLPAAGTPTSTAPAATATTPAAAPTTPAAPATTAVPGAPITAASCQASNLAQIPSTQPGSITGNEYVLVPAAPDSGLGSTRFILGPADVEPVGGKQVTLTGSIIKSAFVSVGQTGQYTVELQFTPTGGQAFDEMAAVRNKSYQANATQQPTTSLEAIELDGQVQSAPTIESANFNGQASISGSFTAAQANSLALVLKYGSLPVTFTPQSVQRVSATIGADSLHAGLLAGLGGIVVVLLYMVLYYRALGLVVIAGLALGGAVLYSLLTLLSQTSSLTLTLSSITGIIVSVGITVDSYVVYFERLKDEVRSGRTIRQSTERSFARAFRTVLTADFVSFLAALILYLLTVGDVRGFAFTLGLSTLLDVATAYLFIRPAVVLVGRRRTFTENRVLGVARGLGSREAAGVAG
ncbi:MAG TPA: protein translocase subunit SecD [Acidimicrobiales bacterium]|nr:protein translocase subunit SecD [Acidimicrobiales bacterium]